MSRGADSASWFPVLVLRRILTSCQTGMKRLARSAVQPKSSTHSSIDDGLSSTLGSCSLVLVLILQDDDFEWSAGSTTDAISIAYAGSFANAPREHARSPWAWRDGKMGPALAETLPCRVKTALFAELSQKSSGLTQAFVSRGGQ
ncbi:hypothetical protein F5Y03DRAFT_392469 [Xylaria venustula]|nr:hypothetical protein F5Y03DRAFT_392469 [Xylaria venustula]